MESVLTVHSMPSKKRPKVQQLLTENAQLVPATLPTVAASSDNDFLVVIVRVDYSKEATSKNCGGSALGALLEAGMPYVRETWPSYLCKEKIQVQIFFCCDITSNRVQTKGLTIF